MIWPSLVIILPNAWFDFTHKPWKRALKFYIVRLPLCLYLGETSVSKIRKASLIPFPDMVTHWDTANQQRQTNPIPRQDMIDGPGYGKGFHTLSDVLSHILKHRLFKWGERKNTTKIISTASATNITASNANMASQGKISSNEKHSQDSQLGKSSTIFQDFGGNDTFLKRNDPLRNHRIQINHDLRETTQWRVSRSRIKVHRHRTRNNYLPSLSSFKHEKRKKLKLRLGTTNKGRGLERRSQRKFRYKVQPVSRMLLKAYGHKTIFPKLSPTLKIRNLRKQVARLRAKLNRFIHLVHHRKRKKALPFKPLPTLSRTF